MGPGGPPATHTPGLVHRCWPPGCRQPPGAGLVELTHLSSVPSTLRSPSSPIHEEDDSEALPPPGGAGLALSSSPEVRPPPCPSVPAAHLLASQPPLFPHSATVTAVTFPGLSFVCGVGTGG